MIRRGQSKRLESGGKGEGVSPLKPVKTFLKVALEVFLEVLEVVLKVLEVVLEIPENPRNPPKV